MRVGERLNDLDQIGVENKVTVVKPGHGNHNVLLSERRPHPSAGVRFLYISRLLFHLNDIVQKLVHSGDDFRVSLKAALGDNQVRELVG
jgi:hypothetical protein